MANTSTAYFTSNKFDLTEMTTLLTLWVHFMFKGLTATLYSIADWLADQITIQFGIQGLTLTESQPKPATIEPMTIEPQPMTIEPVTTIEPEPVTTIEPKPVTIEPEPVTLTYKDLQRLLKEYRDSRGPIEVKLNAKRDTLESEAKRLGLIA
jgi:hypothetical protein